MSASARRTPPQALVPRNTYLVSDLVITFNGTLVANTKGFSSFHLVLSDQTSSVQLARLSPAMIRPGSLRRRCRACTALILILLGVRPLLLLLRVFRRGWGLDKRRFLRRIPLILQAELDAVGRGHGRSVVVAMGSKDKSNTQGYSRDLLIVACCEM